MVHGRAFVTRVAPAATQGTPVFADLVDSVLVLEPQGDGTFLGRSPAETFGRVYGGQVVGQGMRAAAHTTSPSREVHSVHTAFLRLGDPAEPVCYHVERLRDSQTFSTCAVTARQGERLLATLTVSFQEPRNGLEHAQRPEWPAPADPESLPRRREQIARALRDVPEVARVPWPVDLRYVDREPWAETPGAVSPDRVWMRGEGALGDDPVLHACVFGYASDLTMFEPVIARHGAGPHGATWERVSRGEVRGATLDHTVWFHRPFRADEWLLQERGSAVAHGARGLATARCFTADGVLVATVAQEVALLVDPGTREAPA